MSAKTAENRESDPQLANSTNWDGEQIVAVIHAAFTGALLGLTILICSLLSTSSTDRVRPTVPATAQAQLDAESLTDQAVLQHADSKQIDPAAIGNERLEDVVLPEPQRPPIAPHPENRTSEKKLTKKKEGEAPVSEPQVAQASKLPVPAPVPDDSAVAKTGPLPLSDQGGAESTCTMPSLGTALKWAESAEAAAEKASEEGKLVFLIQVSGNFSREEFT